MKASRSQITIDSSRIHRGLLSMTVVGREEEHLVDQQRNSRKRMNDLLWLLIPAWPPPVSHVLWMIRIAIVLGILFLIGYAYEITIWDWLDLLIVPAAIAGVATVGGAWFTRQRTQDAALQAYLDKISELLIDGQLREEDDPYADTRVTARARTLAVLRELDGGRKRIVLLFLREARLINREEHRRDGRKVNPRIVGLRDADFTNANLRHAKLINTARDEPVSLEGAILEGADLQGAVLEGADLSGADLSGAYEIYERRRRLIPNEKLEQQARSLDDATMPDGQKYEEWLKSKARSEDGENGGPS